MTKDSLESRIRPITCVEGYFSVYNKAKLLVLKGSLESRIRPNYLC